MIRMLNNESTKRPLFDYLQQHSRQENVRYHIPGHIGGYLLENRDWQAIARWDVTETFGMDDLHAPESIINEAEILAAKAFGAKRSYFLVNGSSGGLLAAIHGLFLPGDKVLVQRNAHKSIYNGLMLHGLLVDYLIPSCIGLDGIAGVITPDILLTKLQQHPDTKGVIITSPTFYGHAADIKGLVRICKERDIILLVDEAHGAHYPFHKKLHNLSAIAQGADIIINSAHKTLPALTMASLIHISKTASAKINIQRLERYISLFQTTSPSYLVMASIDYARSWMQLHGEQVIERAYDRKRRLIEALGSLSTGLPNSISIKALDQQWIQDGLTDDPLKLTISIADTGISAKEWERQLAKRQIYVELADTNHLLLLLGLDNNIESDERLLSAIEDIGSTIAAKKQTETQRPFQPPEPTTINIVYPLATIMDRLDTMAAVQVKIDDSIDLVSAEFVIPYPPGIPILCPGERISIEHITYINNAKKANIHFQGISDKSFATIKCFM